MATENPRAAPPLREARDLLASRKVARAALGTRSYDHYAHAAEVELDAFNAASRLGAFGI